MAKFGAQYGFDTFDTSLLGEGGAERVYSLEEIAAILGMMKKQKSQYLDKNYQYDEFDEQDPKGY